jgi:hypothetical protein
MPAPVIANSGAQHNSGFASNATTLSVSLTNNVTAGNMILVWVGAGQAGITTVNTPTMTGETLAKVTGASNAGTSGNGQVACYAENSAAGGQKQVTVTTTGTTGDIHLHIQEITGQSASPQDATGNRESATLSVSTSGSTTTATDLIIAFFFDLNTNVTFTATGGSSQIDQGNNGTGGDASFSEQKTVSVIGVQTCTCSSTGTDVCEQGILAIAGTAGASVHLDDDSLPAFIAAQIDPNVSIYR